MLKKQFKSCTKSLSVIDINKKGMGVAKSPEGIVYFIKNTIPGDIVDVNPYKRRKGYIEAEPIKWLTKSTKRVNPKCDHFGICGGCKWQNMKYEEQLVYKEKSVINDLKQIGKVEIQKKLPILGAIDSYFYRNKMEYSFSKNRWLTKNEIEKKGSINKNALGFHKPGRWDKVVDINFCYLQAEPSNTIRNAVRDFALKNKLEFFDPREKKGFLRSIIIRNNLKGEVMVIFQFFKENKVQRELILDFLKVNFKEIKSLLYCINSKENDSIYDQNIICFYGKNFITESIDKLEFKIYPKSFYQTNPKQTKKLYGIIKDFAALKKDEIVYDLYSGIGTITLYLSNYCKKIIGIESISEAVNAAKENCLLNQINNAFFEEGEMIDVFDESFFNKYGKAESIILDPPRGGVNKKIVKKLLILEPKKIVYVSCNSSTQARDLELIKEKYELKISRAVDMFPQTHHVENIVLLHLKSKNV